MPVCEPSKSTAMSSCGSKKLCQEGSYHSQAQGGDMRTTLGSARGRTHEHVEDIFRQSIPAQQRREVREVNGGLAKVHSHPRRWPGDSFLNVR
ncbi:hypothetical protein FA13DRAFT_164258 [Coprinellus micaceus]|uniref:Uncharacterized protein n=1 Tax=Coprinellus micaceus TaxID=71717 RepID=A0A4Y7THL0_COPMI|nr:hypothetical protein FA13DRAFT_164258 [Coprinellus micaceus]